MLKLRFSDLFSGAGGFTSGAKRAARKARATLSGYCCNHNPKAIATHKRNHPEIRHIPQNIMDVDPTPVGKLDFLLASPECTTFSTARGDRPVMEQHRTPGRRVVDWMRATQPEMVLFENVKEWLTWGPLDAKGRPIVEKKGIYFDRYIYRPIRALGYSIDMRVICCADYGDPTTRERLFIQCRRDGRKITWPEPTHGEHPYGNLKQWVPASSIIDWSILGNSVFDRPKQLSPNTMRRIYTGISKYWGDYAEPFLVIMRGKSNCRDLRLPVPTLTTGQHIGLVQPMIIKNYGTSNACTINGPLPTVTSGGNHFGLLEPIIIGQQSGSAPRPGSMPLPTIATSGAIGICQPFITTYYGRSNCASIDQPLDTVTTKGRFGLVQAVLDPGDKLDLLYRMFKPHELAAAMSFDDNYYFEGNQSDAIRQIGNAVPVCTADALVSHMLQQMGYPLLEQAS